MPKLKKISQSNKSLVERKDLQGRETLDHSMINRSRIRNAALEYLARFSTTRDRLARILTRRVLCWQQPTKPYQQNAIADRQESPQESSQETVKALTHDLKTLIDDVVQEMVNLGIVNDEAFSLSCANRLMRTGRSVRAIKKHLTTFGVEESVKKSIFNQQEESERLSETDRDLCAALVLARKRKFGPFASPLLQNFSETEAVFVRQKPYVHQKQEQKKRALAVFARAGFVRDIAERVLQMDEGEAWRWLNRMRSES